MTELAATDIATRWIEKWTAPDGPSVDSDGNDLDRELPFENPRLCLDSILQVLSRIPADPADKHFQVLAAGPLEDLLVQHGDVCVDEIEILARQNPAFRLLLNGVWTSRIDKAVAQRLDKYQRARW
jgi:hypothetical protein